MKLAKRELRNISREVIARLERSAINIANLRYEDFHNFLKTQVPLPIVQAVAKKWGLRRDRLQIEIAQIMTDLTREVHRHDLAHAFVVRIDGQLRIPRGGRGLIYLGDAWRSFEPGQEIDIPPGMPHGFAIKPGDSPIFFLSVQSPPIVDDHGGQDYTRIQPTVPAPIDEEASDGLAAAG